MSSLAVWTSTVRGLPRSQASLKCSVAGKLVHSEKGGDGYVDTESKFLKLVGAIKAALAQASCAPKAKTVTEAQPFPQSLHDRKG